MGGSYGGVQPHPFAERFLCQRIALFFYRIRENLHREVEVKLAQPLVNPFGKGPIVSPQHNEQIGIAPRYSSSLDEGPEEHNLFYSRIPCADLFRQFPNFLNQFVLLKPKDPYRMGCRADTPVL